MDIAILEDKPTDTVRYFTIQAGKQQVWIAVSLTRTDITVQVLNASHTTAFRNRRGTLGKTYWGGFPEALSHYRSAEVKAALQCAADLVSEATKPA